MSRVYFEKTKRREIYIADYAFEPEKYKVVVTEWLFPFKFLGFTIPFSKVLISRSEILYCLDVTPEELLLGGLGIIKSKRDKNRKLRQSLIKFNKQVNEHAKRYAGGVYNESETGEKRSIDLGKKD